MMKKWLLFIINNQRVSTLINLSKADNDINEWTKSGAA